jgi:hypothetical protein
MPYVIQGDQRRAVPQALLDHADFLRRQYGHDHVAVHAQRVDRLAVLVDADELETGWLQ